MAADDSALARDLADAAGSLLLDLRARGGRPEELRAAGDALSHRYLADALRQRRPTDAVLSEEAVDDLSRLGAGRVWIIDPLDGTREFGEPPRTDWAVHVALWQQGGLVAGAVALPARARTYASDRPRQPVAPVRRPVRLAVSRSRPPAFVTSLAQAMGAELVPMGSAGVKATAVLDDEVDAYVHAGGQYEWDSAAPVAVCAAAGLHTSRIDGTALTYNQRDPLLPDLLVCKPSLVHELLSAIDRLDRKEDTA